MKTLTAYQVKNMLQEQPDIYLIMTLGPKAFQKAHIVGSINMWNIELAKENLTKESKIIVYCSDSNCMASYYAYKQLEEAGYKNIWRFAGGLVEWAHAGYPIIENQNK